MPAKLEQLDEISFGLFDERYRNAVAKQNVISIRGDSMVEKKKKMETQYWKML